jgi:hypothetical protein
MLNVPLRPPRHTRGEEHSPNETSSIPRPRQSPGAASEEEDLPEIALALALALASLAVLKTSPSNSPSSSKSQTSSPEDLGALRGVNLDLDLD